MIHVWELADTSRFESRGRELLHALVCEECRNWLIGHLIIHESADHAKDEGYAAIVRKLRAQSAAEEAARAKEGAAVGLFAELEGLERLEAFKRVGEERFLDVGLLERLIQESQAAQMANPLRAHAMAELASRLARKLDGKEPEATTLLARALCLGANASRLVQQNTLAENQLAKAIPFLTYAGDRAAYSRTAGLVRWELGKAEEALALLRHAKKLYQLTGPGSERATTEGLIGLLLYEQEELPNALVPLHRAWTKGGLDQRPLFRLRVGIAYAVALVTAGRNAQALDVYLNAASSLKDLSNRREALLFWRGEARLRSLLKDVEKAEALYRVALSGFLQAGCFGEGAEAAIELALLLWEQGRGDEIMALSDVVQEASPPETLASLTHDILLNIAEPESNGVLRLRAHISEELLKLRHIIRTQFRFQPLPFA